MTKPEVFIIESLKFEEEDDYREGEMIYRSLRMSLKDPAYRYVRTVTEFEHFIDEFDKSAYRYLHVSCHGSKGGLSTTLESMTIDDFAAIVGPVLDGRRLFLSTCLASTPAMAKAVFEHGRCTSLAGPVGKINFDDSVILWTSFYHLMFKADSKKMQRSQIRQTLARSAGLVRERVNFYVRGSGKQATRSVLPLLMPPSGSTIPRHRQPKK